MAFRIPQNKKKHNPIYIGLLLTVFSLFILNLGLTALSAALNANTFKIPANKLFNFSGIGVSEHFQIFPKTVDEVSRIYHLDITPLNWLFPIIWTVIYLYQLLWLIYAFTYICRRTSHRLLLYREFDNISIVVLLSYAANMILTMFWLFTWSFEFKTISFLLVFSQMVSLAICLIFALRKFYNNKHDMIRFSLRFDVALTRALVHNGLAMYLTWIVFACNLSFAIFLTYTCKVDFVNSGTAALSIISLIVVIYFVLENFIFQRFLLYVFTPWIVTIVTLVCVLVQNWKKDSLPSRNNIFAIVLLFVSLVFAVVKLVMFSLYKTKLRSRVKRLIPMKDKDEFELEDLN